WALNIVLALATAEACSSSSFLLSSTSRATGGLAVYMRGEMVEDSTAPSSADIRSGSNSHRRIVISCFVSSPLPRGCSDGGCFSTGDDKDLGRAALAAPRAASSECDLSCRGSASAARAGLLLVACAASSECDFSSRGPDSAARAGFPLMKACAAAEFPQSCGVPLRSVLGVAPVLGGRPRCPSCRRGDGDLA